MKCFKSVFIFPAFLISSIKLCIAFYECSPCYIYNIILLCILSGIAYFKTILRYQQNLLICYRSVYFKIPFFTGHHGDHGADGHHDHSAAHGAHEAHAGGHETHQPHVAHHPAPANNYSTPSYRV